ncbi:DUF6185 family protein [Streptomyces sp. NPDC050535]|uniref:DUF6185 family protein n=1 Tax=Streptomyces sp. NPDC050535 TaxID=3365626 RepID=UPI00378B57CA
MTRAGGRFPSLTATGRRLPRSTSPGAPPGRARRVMMCGTTLRWGRTDPLRSHVSGWAIAVLVLVAALALSITPASSWAAEPSPEERCERAGLTGAKVSTSVLLEHDDRTYAKIVTSLTVDLPGTWPLAHDLLLSEDSRPYIKAMSCLLGSEQGEQRWSEFRTRKPVVTSTGDRIKVVHEAHSWVSYHQDTIEVALWRVRVINPERWTVSLSAPYALWGASWDKITVNPGRPGAEWTAPETTAGEGATALVWHPGRVELGTGSAAKHVPSELDLTVAIRPSWQRSWAALSSHSVSVALNFLGALLWAAALAFLLMTAVRRYRKRIWVPTYPQARSLDNLETWALTAAGLHALAAVDDLTNTLLQVDVQRLCALGSVVVLLNFARPPKHVLWIAITVALVPLAMEMMTWGGTTGATTGSAGLDGLVFAWDQQLSMEGQVAVEAAGSFCLVALLLLGFVAVAWRLASDGRLLPKSQRFPGQIRKFRIRVAGPAILTAAVLMALCFTLVEEQNWQRATWLRDPVTGGFGEEHWQDFLWEAQWSVSYVEDWLIISHSWLLTGLAIVAVLRTWNTSAHLSPIDAPADRLAFLVFFSVVVGLDVQEHLGNSVLEFLWIPLYMLTLYRTTALLVHRSVLAQSFEISGLPLSTVAGPTTRRKLLDKARSYREIHAELRRLDQGLFGDTPPKRDFLEKKLRRLHKWPVNSSAGAVSDRLPATVSVVDAALALGPRDGWWGNGVRAARFALVPGSLAAVLNTWVEQIRGEGWQNTLSDLLGIPNLVITFIAWIATFAAAGFVLGALWRVLPGRRGAIKALPVTGAFALPVGLDVLVGWFTDEGSANAALQVSTMLFVLTVTAIGLDLDTFRGERRYWQSRLGLLLSIYQMRYYSLQVAYLVGQIIAMISIWQFFAESATVPSQGDQPPSGD